MRKVYVLAAVAATMLAACSSKDVLDVGQQTSNQPPLEEGAVGFDAYTQRSVTRAGLPGQMTLSQLQQSAADGGGFGVFGYYTDNNDYDQQRIPDFMYNQKVEYSGGSWNYEPVKYWPNEYGASAISDDNDKVSFFAYAPYVDVVPSSGKLTASADEAKWGITGLSRNSATGDPLVKYIVSFDQDKSVDLMWGVCDDPLWSIIEGGTKQKINDGEAGKPWLNVCRPQDPTDNQRMKFTFKHALAQLKVNVDAFVDGYDKTNPLNAANTDLGKQTRIFIRQISFTGFALKGALNLNNSEQANKAYWLDYNGSADLESGESVTIYDGRKDGKEGAAGSAASNEKTLGLNPQFVQDAEWNSNDMALGVTETAAPLFRKLIPNSNPATYTASDAPLMVIPTGEDIEVEIVYDVETADENLATYVSDKKQFGSSIENRIRKDIKFGDANFESGKCYTINLHLGMNSVKLDAAVSDWQEVGVSPDIHLPSNMPTFTASNSSAATDYTSDASIDHNTTDYIFAVSGLNGGESVSVTLDPSLTGATYSINSMADLVSGNNGVADVTGIAYIAVSNLPVNLDVLNNKITSAIKVEGNASHKQRVINLTQLAHPLGMSVTLNSTGGSLLLATTANMSDVANWQVNSSSAATSTTDYYIEVLKNGTKLTQATSASANVDGKFRLDGTKIRLGSPAIAGDVYTITIKTGDAQEETIQAKVGGLSFADASPSIVYGTQNWSNPVVNNGATIGTYSVSTSNSVATVDGTSGVITTLKPGTETIKVTFSGAEGYVVSSDNATYDLTVTQATGCEIKATAANQNIAAASIAGTKVSDFIKLYNAEGAELTAGASDGGSVNYEITAQTYTDGGNGVPSGTATRVKLDTDNETLVRFGNYAVYAPVAGDVYTIKATVTGNANAAYTTTEATFTITVQ